MAATAVAAATIAARLSTGMATERHALSRISEWRNPSPRTSRSWTIQPFTNDSAKIATPAIATARSARRSVTVRRRAAG